MLKRIIPFLFLVILGFGCTQDTSCEICESCNKSFTLIDKGFCPSGFLFENAWGKTVFIDYFQYKPTNIPIEEFEQLAIGEKINMNIQKIDVDSDTFEYSFINFYCADETLERPETEIWAKVTCFQRPSSE